MLEYKQLVISNKKCIQSDSTSAITAISKDTPVESEDKILVEYIKEMMKKAWIILMTYQTRERNSLENCLSHLGHDAPSLLIVLEEPSHQACEILTEYYIGD